jgi:hypothetical protein
MIERESATIICVHLIKDMMELEENKDFPDNIEMMPWSIRFLL